MGSCAPWPCPRAFTSLSWGPCRAPRIKNRINKTLLTWETCRAIWTQFAAVVRYAGRLDPARAGGHQEDRLRRRGASDLRIRRGEICPVGQAAERPRPGADGRDHPPAGQQSDQPRRGRAARGRRRQQGGAGLCGGGRVRGAGRAVPFGLGLFFRRRADRRRMAVGRRQHAASGRARREGQRQPWASSISTASSATS